MAGEDPVIVAPPPLDDNEAARLRRRRQREEEEMERLLLAQEQNGHDDDEINEQHQDDDAEPLVNEEEEPLMRAQATSPTCPRLSYTQTSFVAAFCLLYYALRTRQQWYLALVYLTSSKWAYIVFGNALIALCVSTFRIFTKWFLQGLRLAEAEGLGDFFRWNVTETCLALTMFRGELQVDTFLVFLLLILAKCMHWVAEMREQYLRMTQDAVVSIQDHGTLLKGWPRIPWEHLRLYLLLNILIVLDIIAVAHCGYSISQNGPSVDILFGFEAAILLVTAMSCAVLWNLHVMDGLLHYLHDSSAAPAYQSWLHAWKDHKATLIFAVELQAQGAKFLFYVTFFAIVLTYYGLPINLFREVYVSFQNLRSRLLAFAKYRKLMASMDRFESLQTEEELEEAGKVCIICRDEMTLASCRRLPGCGHVFHKSCLREWLVQQQTCPTCRGDITAMEERQRQQQRAAQEAEARQQVEQQAEPPQDQDGVAAATPVAAAQRTTPTTTRTEAASVARLEEEARATVATTPGTKKTVSIQEPPVVFPCLYRVKAEWGAHVWNEQGTVDRTVSLGVAILCTKLQWKSFDGRSGMMLRMPDGWVKEDEVERLHSVRLPLAPPSNRGD